MIYGVLAQLPSLLKIMTNKTASIRKMNCPSCQKTITWSEEYPFRPFCSKQCQLIDFGDWASERNAIPAEDKPGDFKLDDLEPGISGSDFESPEGF